MVAIRIDRDPCPQHHRQNKRGATWLYGYCASCKLVIGYTSMHRKESDLCPDCGRSMQFKKVAPPYYMTYDGELDGSSLLQREGLSGFILPSGSWEYNWHLNHFFNPNDVGYYIQSDAE